MCIGTYFYTIILLNIVINGLEWFVIVLASAFIGLSCLTTLSLAHKDHAESHVSSTDSRVKNTSLSRQAPSLDTVSSFVKSLRAVL